MRVIQAIAGAANGGAEAFYARLVPALGEAGLTQLAVVKPYPERMAALAAAKVPVAPLPFFSTHADLYSRWKFRRIVREWRPDIVVTWSNRPSVIAPAGRVKGGAFVKVGRMGGYYDLKYYRGCDWVVGNTPAIRDYIAAHGVPSDRARYLPNFVDASQGHPLPRAPFGTPDGAPLVVALGRLHRNKAFDTLLKAMARLPEAHLWLAGSGPEERALKTLAAELDLEERVKFLGWRSDVADLLATADIFCCPSRHEPFGNVVAEAWAAGRPVVAAASPGPRALIENGRNGVLVPVDDPVALARALDDFIADPARAHAIGTQGQASFERQFSRQSVVRQWLSFLNSIKDGPAP